MFAKQDVMRYVGVQRANIEFNLYSSLLLLPSRDPNFKSHLELKKMVSAIRF